MLLTESSYRTLLLIFKIAERWKVSLTSFLHIIWIGKKESSTYFSLCLEGYLITHKAVNALTYLFPKGSDKSVYTSRNFLTSRTIPSVVLWVTVGDCICAANFFFFFLIGVGREKGVKFVWHLPLGKPTSQITNTRTHTHTDRYTGAWEDLGIWAQIREKSKLLYFSLPGCFSISF